MVNRFKRISIFFIQPLKKFHLPCQLFASVPGGTYFDLSAQKFYILKNKEEVMTTGMIKKDNARVPATSFGGLVDQFFQDNLGRFFEDGFWGFNGLAQRANVPVNLKETDTSYEMQLVAPGLKKEDFNIRLDGDMLTVSFEHKEEKQQEDKNQRWLRKEFRQQSFARSFTLDDTLSAEKISAQYRDGILHLSLPKKEGAQRVSRQIEIK